jgi:hypothetical protein
MANMPKLEPYADPLTPVQTQEAVRDKVKFPEIVRSNIDTPIPGQKYALVTQTLFSEPKKDKAGNIVYGFMKNRGNYADEASAKAAAGKIIKEQDSHDAVLITPVGTWLPIKPNMDYVAEKLDVRMDANEIQFRDEEAKEKQAEQRRKLRELKEREEEIKEDYEAAKRERMDKNRKIKQDLKEREDKLKSSDDGKDLDTPGTLDHYTKCRATERMLTDEIIRVREALRKLVDKRNTIWKGLRIVETTPAGHDFPERWLPYYNKKFAEVGIPEYRPRADQFDEYNASTLELLADVQVLKEYEELDLRDIPDFREAAE